MGPLLRIRCPRGPLDGYALIGETRKVALASLSLGPLIQHPPEEEMSPIVPDEKDWTVVLSAPCSECSHDVRHSDPEDIMAQLPEQIDRLVAVLDRPAARERQNPSRWSDQEYVVHVAEMLQVMVQRLNLMLSQDAPTFPNWDQDRAADEGDYRALEPAVAAQRLRAAASDFNTRIQGISPQDYTRRGLRSNGAAFTITTLLQYAWHDVLHHLWDVRATS